MSRERKVWGAAAVVLLLALLAGLTYVAVRRSPAQAAPQETIRVEAFIDGRSRLCIRGNSVWWQHMDFAEPGLHGGRDRPTVINGHEWRPLWVNLGSPKPGVCRASAHITNASTRPRRRPP